MRADKRRAAEPLHFVRLQIAFAVDDADIERALLFEQIFGPSAELEERVDQHEPLAGSRDELLEVECGCAGSEELRHNFHKATTVPTYAAVYGRAGSAHPNPAE